MKGSSYKKTTTGECHFCDYKCRKGHKCNHYKKIVKNKNKRSQVASLLFRNEDKDYGN